MKKNFDDCLELIKLPKIREFAAKALALAPEQFWIAPCSSSGKYHPPEDQVKGGCIVHSRKAVQVALSLFRFFNIQDRLVKDKIIAACILHDIQKGGIPWAEKTDYKHGPIAASWLISIADSETDEDLADVAELVRNHMAIWNCPKPTPALNDQIQIINPKTIWHLIVQLADYWASRKWCPFICDELEE